MPAELVSRIDLDLLYPPFLEKYLETLAACKALGAAYIATSGYRSPDEQLKLWQKGRNASGSVTRPSQIVTKLKFSAHCAGIAADSVRDGSPAPGLQPAWTLKDYEILANEGIHRGLEAGAKWKGFPDGPHLQLPLLAKRVSLQKLSQLHDQGGLAAVWAYLDTKGPW